MRKMTIKFFFLGFLFFSPIFMGCKPTIEDQVIQYMEFYYPPGGVSAETNYEIIYDWGLYVFTTGAGPNTKLSPLRELYRGYVSARAQKTDKSKEGNYPTYLITSSGEVWMCENIGDLREVETIEEKTDEPSEYGNTISISVLHSSLKPIVDHFIANPSLWKSYGKMEPNGDLYKFIRNQ